MVKVSLAAAILAAIATLLFGLWLGGGRRVPEGGVAWREPYADDEGLFV